ncbi:hypothetical protein [Sphingomonas montanisoli]|uniref:Tyrosine-type recombinase/integrase n=1 Tax=Sphingomonas montanisoli TaxID=2606412 RepID=A0A5D9C139_9SPHN|nr:hypothetical protein [Sphingomonas montanisoli]TZG24907.1 hypothetical protein FYJ91_16640 [Sphingomonas montanisoli]
MVQSKTGKAVTWELSAAIGDEVVLLYPELEAELARMKREGGKMIVRDERTGQPYRFDYMQKLHARIRAKAGLPADLRMTSFRHGGMTEIGDAGVDDMRPVSGHTKLDTTAIYNKASAEKARQIALKRREHVTILSRH